MVDERLARAGTALARRHEVLAARRPVPSWEIRSPDGLSRRFGSGAPEFTIVVRDQRGAQVLADRDQLGVAQAYLEGSLDVEGDMAAALSMRDLFHDWHPIAQAGRFLGPLIHGQVSSDDRFISTHYDEDPEFFLTFMDSRHRCYSHALYEEADESLEDAMTRKMAFALAAIPVKPGE